LYALNDPRDFDYLDILGKFRIDQKSHPVFKFKTVAENFHIIDDLTQTLIIPFDDNAARLIDELRFAQYPLAILRKLQPYTVSIYEQEFDAISALGVVEMILEKYAVLANKNELYDMDMGLIIPEDKGGNGLYF